MRLIVGAGKHAVKQPGDILLDVRRFPGIDVVHDLNKTPWPFPDDSFMHVSAIHVVEHLNSLVTFMDEAWRILKNGCSVYIETPEAGNLDLSHTDPTHIRCFRLYTWHNYFSPEGIEKFGYTDRPWCMLKTETINGILIIHASTIKK